MLPNGVPRKEVFRRVPSCWQFQAFQTCFMNWHARRGRASGLGTLHAVTLRAAEFGLTLAHAGCDDTSNRMIEVPCGET